MLPGQSGPVTQLAAGGDDSLVVTSGGQLYAFGENQSGQLGRATNSGTNNPNPTPALVALPGQSGPVTQIAAGGDDSLVVTSGGQLYAFGLNLNGQFGSATNSGTSNPNPTPALVTLEPDTTIDTVAKGPQAAHALALVSGLAITSGSLPAGRVGSPYSAALSAAGGTAPLRWSASGLAPGLSVDAQSGVVSGTTTAPGSFPIAVVLTDSYGSQTLQTFTLTIAPPPPAPPPTIASATPTITSATQSNPVWREGTSLAVITKKRPPIGTTFSVTLNERVQVSFAFTQNSPDAGSRPTASRRPKESPPARLQAHGDRGHAVLHRPCRPQQGFLPRARLRFAQACPRTLHAGDRGQVVGPVLVAGDAELHDRPGRHSVVRLNVWIAQALSTDPEASARRSKPHDTRGSERSQHGPATLAGVLLSSIGRRHGPSWAPHQLDAWRTRPALGCPVATCEAARDGVQFGVQN